MASAAPAFNTITSVMLNGQHTDIICHRFANKLCLFITQYGRISNIFVARPNVQDGGNMVRNEYKEIVHQFGTDTDEIQSAVRHLVAKVPMLNDSTVDVVINCGLKEINRTVLCSLVEALCSIVA